MEKIYYCDIDSPLGKVWAATSSTGLMRLNLPCTESRFLQELSRQVGTEPEYRPGKLDQLSEWLENYFKGKPMTYDEPFDLQGTDFQKRVWKEIYKIPYGRLTAYGLIAKDIGKPNASRAVGNAVGQNPLTLVIPCHRVVWNNGGIGGFGGGLEMKRYLLKLEGVLPSAEGAPEKAQSLCRFFYNR
jgi:methylated-DNA-[protein]-cysteine S-methyltransferase